MPGMCFGTILCPSRRLREKPVKKLVGGKIMIQLSK